MDTHLLRRDLFKFAGGSVAGLMLTPVPWRLITDSALWSESWPGVPNPPRGEIRTRFTHCSLCPAGCAVKARCVGEQPVSLAGASGALCAFGIAAHHLPFHPARLRQAQWNGKPVAASEAQQRIQAAMAQRGAGESVAVLDLRPERTASWMYRMAMAAVPGGIYIAPAAAPDSRIDLERVKTLLSFGVPVVDGWGTPGRVMAMRDRIELIQVEAVESRTAMLADLWLPANPGSEEALALGLLQKLDVSEVAARTGLAPGQILALAQRLRANGPSLVLGEGAAVRELNRVLNSPLLQRSEAPVPEEWRNAAPVTPLAGVADRSVRVLFIDETLPGEAVAWSAMAPKLAADALVVSFACSLEGFARHAQLVLPVAVPGEAAQDSAGAVDQAVGSFRVAAPLVSAPAGMVDPVAVIAAACGATLPEKPLEQRAAAIHQAGRGTLLTYADGKTVPVKSVAADAFWKALNEGGRWEDEPGGAVENHAAARADGRTRGAAFPGGILASVAGDAVGSLGSASHVREAALQVAPADGLHVVMATEARGVAAPMMTKVYQESGLRQSPNQAALHPATARECGVGEGARARISTGGGACEVHIVIDDGVMPGLVRVMASPAMADLFSGAAQRALVVRI